MVADARAEDAANFSGMKGHKGLRVARRPTNQEVGPGVRESVIRRRSPEAGVSLLGSVPRLEAEKAREGSCRGLLERLVPISNMQERRGFRPMSTLTKPEFSELSPQGHKSVEGKSE